MRKIIIPFGPYGDVKAEWDEENNDVVLPEIQKLIDANYLFFVLKADSEETEQVTQVDQVNGRSIIIPNETLEKLHQEGYLNLSSALTENVENTGEIARTAEEVANADTIVTPPAQGG